MYTIEIAKAKIYECFDELNVSVEEHENLLKQLKKHFSVFNLAKTTKSILLFYIKAVIINGPLRLNEIYQFYSDKLPIELTELTSNNITTRARIYWALMDYEQSSWVTLTQEHLYSIRNKPGKISYDAIVERLKGKYSLQTLDVSELYVKYHASLIRFIRSKIQNQAIAEDIASEAFLKIIEGINFRDESDLSTYLFGIARNILAEYYRKNNKYVYTDELEDKSHVDSPENIMESRQTVIIYNHAFDRLIGKLGIKNEEELNVFVDLIGGSNNELAAKTLQVPIGTIRSRLHRVRKFINSNIASSGLLLPA